MAYTENWNKEFKKNTIFLDPNSLTNVVELGVYEGATSNYIAEKLLNSDGKLLAIDPLSDEYHSNGEPDIFKGQYDRFIENTKDNSKIQLIRAKSQRILPLLADNSQDLVLVDSEHTYDTVAFEAPHAFRILKEGGYLLFDDLLWGENYPVKRAVDDFLSNLTDYALLLNVNQLLIQKLPKGSGIQDKQKEYQSKCCEILFNDSTIYCGYVNLDSRPERNELMIKELTRVGFKVVA